MVWLFYGIIRHDGKKESDMKRLLGVVLAVLIAASFPVYAQYEITHPLVKGMVVSDAVLRVIDDLNMQGGRGWSALVVAFDRSPEGLVVPFERVAGMVACSGSCTPEFYLTSFPRIRILGANGYVRRIDRIANGAPGTTPMDGGMGDYEIDIPEIVGQTLVRRTWKPGAEKLEFSGMWAVEIIAPASHQHLKVYVEQNLWDVWPSRF